MKLNWAERLVVNNPLRVLEQRQQINWLQARHPLPAEAVVLEVGCGRGAGARSIRRSFRQAFVHAMDLDPQMLRKADRYLSPAERENISRYAGDLTHLPHRDRSFDAVFGFGVLHHLPDWQQGLAEISRVLKDGGVFYMEELYPAVYQNFITRHLLLHPQENRFRSRDLKERLTALGLEVEHALEYPWLGILAVVIRRDGLRC
jgi:ubiquinone/menaquinone biosynthesis C-methylase UbiE